VTSKVALVTGASSGFGRAIATELGSRGYRVYGASRGTPAPQSPGGFRMVTLDVDSDESVAEGVARVVSDAGPIDVLVNNAGMGYAGAVEDTSVEEAKQQFETNFFGMHRMCRAVLPQMRERGVGWIVNMSSLGGRISIPFQPMYCASKFAVEAYTEALRMEVRPYGIRVAMIEPGDFSTGFTANRRMTAGSVRSAYAARCEAAVRRMAQDEGKVTDITPVVRAVVAAIESDAPRLRYPVASALQRILTGLVPFLPRSVVEYLVMDTYRIR
jgi:NAD(P)-dependent dehydrogenase (short-subunit alcohol dehydrogenase family)